jgi:hypothetical protein
VGGKVEFRLPSQLSPSWIDKFELHISNLFFK